MDSCRHVLSQKVNLLVEKISQKRNMKNYLETHSSTQVANRVIRRTTMVMILTTCSWFQRATTPCQAARPKLKCTTASAGKWTFKSIVTYCWRFHWGGWGRWRWRWIRSRLNWEWWLNVHSTYPIGVAGTITLHSDVPLFSPTWAPWVLNYPVIQTITVSSITHGKNTMIQVGPTLTCEHTLETQEKLETQLNCICLL